MVFGFTSDRRRFVTDCAFNWFWVILVARAETLVSRRNLALSVALLLHDSRLASKHVFCDGFRASRSFYVPAIESRSRPCFAPSISCFHCRSSFVTYCHCSTGFDFSITRLPDATETATAAAWAALPAGRRAWAAWSRGRAGRTWWSPEGRAPRCRPVEVRRCSRGGRAPGPCSLQFRQPLWRPGVGRGLACRAARQVVVVAEARLKEPRVTRAARIHGDLGNQKVWRC